MNRNNNSDRRQAQIIGLKKVRERERGEQNSKRERKREKAK